MSFTAAHDPELLETLSFFAFAHSSSSYDGTCMFELTYPDGKVAKKAVRVHPTKGVRIFHGEPDDGVVTCRTAMKRDVFLDVYMGTLHPRNAIINGDVKVMGWAYREMANFGLSFDFRTEKWDAFYKWKETQPEDTATVCRLKPLPFHLPRPRNTAFSLSSSQSQASSSFDSIPFLSSLFSPSPVSVCEPSSSSSSDSNDSNDPAASVSQSVVSAPSVAFSPEHVQHAFSSIQSHRTHVPDSFKAMSDSLLGDKMRVVQPAVSSFLTNLERMGSQAATTRSKILQSSQGMLGELRGRQQQGVSWLRGLVEDCTSKLSVSSGSNMTKSV